MEDQVIRCIVLGDIGSVISGRVFMIIEVKFRGLISVKFCSVGLCLLGSFLGRW